MTLVAEAPDLRLGLLACENVELAWCCLANLQADSKRLAQCRLQLPGVLRVPVLGWRVSPSTRTATSS